MLARKPETRLAEDLGLSSLDRVELLSEVETRFGTDLDEGRFSEIQTVAELRSQISAGGSAREKAKSVAAWPLNRLSRIARTLIQRGLVLPLFRHYLPLEIRGLNRLPGTPGPVIFAANHTSHLDTIALAAALPSAWRRLLSPAMSKDHFRAWFERHSPVTGLLYALARLVFNGYPLAQEAAGVKQALEYAGQLADRGFCPLIYPEGKRTPDGRIHTFRPESR